MPRLGKCVDPAFGHTLGSGNHTFRRFPKGGEERACPHGTVPGTPGLTAECLELTRETMPETPGLTVRSLELTRETAPGTRGVTAFSLELTGETVPRTLGWTEERTRKKCSHPTTKGQVLPTPPPEAVPPNVISAHQGVFP